MACSTNYSGSSVWVGTQNTQNINTESEFNEFESRRKSPKNRFQSKKIEYNFKWNQPYLSRGSNSLNSASDLLITFNVSHLYPLTFSFIFSFYIIFTIQVGLNEWIKFACI